MRLPPAASGSEVVGALSSDRVFDEAAVLAEDVRLLTIIAGMLAHDVQARRVAVAERTALAEENTRLRNELADRFRPENILAA